MKKKSAGIVFYRFHQNILQIFLVHPGGPFLAKRDNGVWSIPKGEFEENEHPLEAAKREVEEETGIKPGGNFTELNPVKQKGGKTIHAWAQERNIETTNIKSNMFEIEWPPKSGEKKSFPEIDKAAWFTIDEALKKIIEGQAPLIKELKARLDIAN